jgi:serine/threonine protein kinase
VLQAGTQLHDRYRVVRRVGRGGMGAVYEAIDTRLRNTVAVKQLEIAGAAADRAFEREAQLLAGLRHPVLPVVIDYFSAAHDAFLVMQYIEGEDLEQHLGRHQRPCERDELIVWANALLDGLEYLHSRSPSIIHRDIKPSNVKRTPAGDVVLLDFGLAKGRLDADDTAARDNSLYGFTLQYAPLEQIDGLGTDVRSDLFALGATLYHLATGAPPPTAVQRSMAIKNGLPDPLVPADVVHPAVGPVLSAALTRALQLDPAKRFASATEMRSTLSALSEPPARPAEPTTAARRVDAALPTHVEVGRQTDLIVQVRFADSPLLGIEDWPTPRRPEQLDQQSEPLQVRHLVDQTGRLLPARVRIRIVAADFAIQGDAERVIEVPVNDYSKRMAFLLTPQRAGYCRVNVEVYALDSLFLGAVAVEAEAASAQVIEAMPTVAHVVLGVFARRAAGAAKPPRPAVSSTSDTVRIKITPELAAAIAAERTPAPAPRDATTSATMVAARLPMAPSAAPSTVAAPPQPPQPPPVAAPVPAVPPQPPLPPPVAAEVPAVPPPRASATQASKPRPRASFASRLPMFGSAAAAILIAGLVFTVWPRFSRSLSSPQPETPSTPAATAPAPAATTPVAAPPREPIAAPTTPAPPPVSSPSPVARPPVIVPPRATPAPATAPRPPASIPEPARRPLPTPAAVPPAPPPAAPTSSPAAPPTPVAAPSPAAPAPSSAAPAPSSAAPPPAPAAPPSPPATASTPGAAPSRASNAGGSASARIMEEARKLEQSGELAQALAEYERAHQLLEADVTRLKEALQGGLVTPRRVEAAEATLVEATQSIARVRARLDAQRRKK